MGGPAYGLTHDQYNKKFGDRIAYLENQRRILERRIEDLSIDAQAGIHFKQLMKVVQENPLVKKEWERFMMVLKVSGYDNSE